MLLLAAVAECVEVFVVGSWWEELVVAPLMFAVDKSRFDRQVSDKMQAPESVSLSSIAFAWKRRDVQFYTFN